MFAVLQGEVITIGTTGRAGQEGTAKQSSASKVVIWRRGWCVFPLFKTLGILRSVKKCDYSCGCGCLGNPMLFLPHMPGRSAGPTFNLTSAGVRCWPYGLWLENPHPPPSKNKLQVSEKLMPVIIGASNTQQLPCCLLVSADAAFKFRCNDCWFYAGGISVFYKHSYAFCLEKICCCFRSKSIKEAHFCIGQNLCMNTQQNSILTYLFPHIILSWLHPAVWCFSVYLEPVCLVLSQWPGQQPGKTSSECLGTSKLFIFMVPKPKCQPH